MSGCVLRLACGAALTPNEQLIKSTFEIATGAPGYSSVLPKSMAPLAMTLKLNGYATAQFGKNHEVPVWQTSPIGPFDAWPTGGGGFEYFYGFLGGEALQSGGVRVFGGLDLFGVGAGVLGFCAGLGPNLGD